MSDDLITDPEQLGIGDVILVPVMFKKDGILTGRYETEYVTIIEVASPEFAVRGVSGTARLHFMDVDWIKEWTPIHDIMDVKINSLIDA